MAESSVENKRRRISPFDARIISVDVNEGESLEAEVEAVDPAASTRRQLVLKFMTMVKPPGNHNFVMTCKFCGHRCNGADAVALTHVLGKGIGGTKPTKKCTKCDAAILHEVREHVKLTVVEPVEQKNKISFEKSTVGVCNSIY